MLHALCEKTFPAASVVQVQNLFSILSEMCGSKFMHLKETQVSFRAPSRYVMWNCLVPFILQDCNKKINF